MPSVVPADGPAMPVAASTLSRYVHTVIGCPLMPAPARSLPASVAHSRTRRRQGLYVLEKPLRELVTVKLPSRRAETLIQWPSQPCAFILATNGSGAFSSAPAVTE